MNFFETVRSLYEYAEDEVAAAHKATQHAHDTHTAANKDPHFDNRVKAYAAHKKAANAHRAAMNKYRRTDPEYAHHEKHEQRHSGQANLFHASLDE
jgi:hypothetical protein